MSGWILAALMAGLAGGVKPAPAPAAQGGAARTTIGGEVRVTADVLPRLDAVEARPEASLQVARSAGRWRAAADVAVEALAARRGEAGDGFTGAAIARVRDAWVEVTGRRGDLRAGFGTLPWGRLDEVQPSDVINPLDTTRFFLHGRRDARLPVAFVRGRLFASDRMSVEGVLAPVFRRGVFDRLDEETSPFTLTRDAAAPPGVTLPSTRVHHESPRDSGAGLSGGGRLSMTVGRTDASLAIYRGFDAFGPIVLETNVLPGAGPVPVVVGRLVGLHPRFTMIAGDFETVRGAWGVRGEVAAFVEKTLAAPTATGTTSGHVVEGGIGADRRWGGTTQLFVSVLVHREWSGEAPAVNRTDVNLVGSIERTFGRDRYRARMFGVANPADGSAFLRALLAWSVRDDVAIDVSAGTFLGSGDDAIARFDRRDFALLGVRFTY
ncbi:MAG: hypothetical protein R2752_20375 [Vicinamibacterales bacterium]